MFENSLNFLVRASPTPRAFMKTHIEELLVFVFLTNFVEFFDQFRRNEIWVGAAPAA